VERAFQLLEKDADVVVVEAGVVTELAGLDPKRRHLFLRTPRQPFAESLVDDLLEWAASALHLFSELCRDVVIERQCGSHVLMLSG